ncbi:hypothetical protein Syun_020692 [Stephania yunnanensis]|uniref:Small ribosomal subunit protein bS18c n=1 Tax=Stephania yunnanensis TaxID=152371 RepID=A0AAP0IEY1_9MAGN
MKLIGVALRGIRDGGLSRRYGQSCLVRTLGTNTSSDNASEPADDFEKRIFGGFSPNGPNTDLFYQKLDRLEKARGRSGFGSRMKSNEAGQNTFQFVDGMDESFSTLSDGMDGNLKNAARYFEFDHQEVEKDDYSFRPDVTFTVGMTYDTKDLDLRRPGVRKTFRRPEFETTTEEVLRKADFRNVRFLANFITEAGIIIKRNMTKISAKAQRKVAREIKTARAFGLMPFTTMGEDRFVFGKSREDPYADERYGPVFTRRRDPYSFTRTTEDHNENGDYESETSPMESANPIG